MRVTWSGGSIVRSVLIAVFVLVGAVLFVWRNSTARAQSHVPVHMTTDWSSRHVVFSTPTTAEQSRKIQLDQRYVRQQLARQNAAQAQGKP